MSASGDVVSTAQLTIQAGSYAKIVRIGSDGTVTVNVTTPVVIVDVSTDDDIIVEVGLRYLVQTQRLHSRGFTLIEVLVSTSIASILFAAIGSCILIASRAYPSQSSPLARAITATQAADLIAADVRFANKIVSGSVKSLVFTVKDRTGDGIDDVIAYVWSGTPGDPLLRYFNSSATENIATPDFG